MSLEVVLPGRRTICGVGCRCQENCHRQKTNRKDTAEPACNLFEHNLWPTLRPFSSTNSKQLGADFGGIGGDRRRYPGVHACDLTSNGDNCEYPLPIHILFAAKPFTKRTHSFDNVFSSWLLFFFGSSHSVVDDLVFDP